MGESGSPLIRNMIKEQSKQTYFLLEQKVLLDITERGWVGILTPSETPYDIIVDMGIFDDRKKFVTIQVKKDLRTTSRPSGGKGEPVSSNGKDRNSYYYYDKDVTLLATYDFKKQRAIYIHKNDYKYLKPKDLKKVNEYNFPINENMSSYRKTNSTSPKPINVFEVSK